MAIENNQLANANEVRNAILLNSSNFMINRGATMENEVKLVNSPDAYVMDLVQNDWAQTSTGMSAKSQVVPKGEYYKDDNATYTMTSYPIPLVSANSKIFAIPHYEIYKLYDECDNSSVSGTNWVRYSGSGTATEDSQMLTLVQSTSGTTKYRTSAMNSETLICVNYDARYSGSGAGGAQLCLTDGTTDLNFFSTNASNSSFYGQILIRLDIPNERAIISYRGYKFRDTNTIPEKVYYSDVFDISSLTTNYYFGFNCVSDGGDTATVNIYNLRLGKYSPSTTVDTSISRDGSNYTSFTNLVYNADTGTNLYLKATGTVASNEVLVFKGWTFKEIVS